MSHAAAPARTRPRFENLRRLARRRRCVFGALVILAIAAAALLAPWIAADPNDMDFGALLSGISPGRIRSAPTSLAATRWRG